MNTSFTYDGLPGHIVFGPGAARRDLLSVIDTFHAHRVLVIASDNEIAAAMTLCTPFSDRVHGTFTAVRPHVPVDVAEAARAAAGGADLVLSYGGGSTTGTAKAVALTTGLPVVCIPTTYAGSEITPVWGMTEGGRKTTGVDARVLPKAVVYDPELTSTLPLDLSVASGLNAVAHCVEAFWAPRRNPISSAIAEDGIRHLAIGLPALAAEPTDIAARTPLLLGAYLAGTAFAAAGSGLHHKICHALGGAFDLPHAQTHAIVLPHVLAFNAPSAPIATERIGRALDHPDPVAALSAMGQDLGIPAGLRDVGMPEDGIDVVLDDILAIVPADNPTPVSPDTLRELLRAAWAGETPRA